MRRLLLFVSIIMLAACSTEYEQPVEKVKTVSSKSFKVSEEEAKQRLERLLPAFEPSTRGNKRTIKEVVAYRSKRTRSYAGDVPDTLMYIMNFDDNHGYAILSSDSRFPFILALVDTGNYVNRTYPSPEFDPALLNMLEFDELDDFWCCQKYDSLPYLDMIEDYLQNGPYQLVDTIVNLDKQVGPFLTTKWGQEHPYNQLCDGSPSNIGNPRESPYPAGCIPVALAQILAYHRHPSAAYGHTYDWAKIRSVAMVTPALARANPSLAYQVSHLIRACGIASNTQYKVDGSWSTAKRAEKALKNTFGYTGVTRQVKFAGEDIQLSLNNRTMALITGLKGRSFKGHAWVIDGYRKYKTNTIVTTYTDETYTTVDDITNIGVSEQVYYHCNFGWDGVANGYYLGEVFNTIDGPAYTEPDEPYSVGQRNYKWWFRTVTYTSPN